MSLARPSVIQDFANKFFFQFGRFGDSKWNKNKKWLRSEEDAQNIGY